MYEFNIEKIENRLQINFNNKHLLETALTHSSYANQYKGVEYNERLEFLGDSVLQICISEYLFNNCKDKLEGELTKMRALIVCENSLYTVAKVLGLGELIRMSKGEELTGGRERISIQADCLEALIAAIYLDKGLEFARNFIIIKFKSVIADAINDKIILDFKTKLQEKLQENGEININYELVKYEGPPHRRKFYTKVVIGEQIIGEGEGFSKKEAEQQSAKNALDFLEGANE